MIPSSADAAPSVHLRLAQADDVDFLLELYASTRAEELGRTGWDEATKRDFLRMQFTAQSVHYTRHFSSARFDIIEVNGTRIGRLSVLRSAEEIRIIDVALLPAWRSKGIGTRLIRPILDEGRASGRPVTLSVERWNPAKRLYARLGFRDESSDYIYVGMRYVAGPSVD